VPDSRRLSHGPHPNLRPASGGEKGLHYLPMRKPELPLPEGEGWGKGQRGLPDPEIATSWRKTPVSCDLRLSA